MGRKHTMLEARVTILEAKCDKLEAAVQALVHDFDRGRGGTAAAGAAKRAIVVPIRPDREPPEQRLV